MALFIEWTTSGKSPVGLKRCQGSKLGHSWVILYVTKIDRHPVHILLMNVMILQPVILKKQVRSGLFDISISVLLPVFGLVWAPPQKAGKEGSHGEPEEAPSQDIWGVMLVVRDPGQGAIPGVGQQTNLASETWDELWCDTGSFCHLVHENQWKVATWCPDAQVEDGEHRAVECCARVTRGKTQPWKEIFVFKIEGDEKTDLASQILSWSWPVQVKWVM